ncbi:MAG: hypothetical protein WB816_11035 [Methylocystis sp.]
MLITLSNAMTRKLAALPEAGMGYQRVDVELRDGRRLEDVMVLESTLLDVPATAGKVDSDDILDIEVRSAPGAKRMD